MKKKRPTKADLEARAEMVRNAKITRKLVERRMTDAERRLREQLANEPD